MNEYIIILLILAVVLLVVNVIYLKYTFDYSKSMSCRHYRELMREYKKINKVLFEINDHIVNCQSYDYIGIANQFAMDVKSAESSDEDKPNLVDIAMNM